jgi:hypothetical protein
LSTTGTIHATATTVASQSPALSTTSTALETSTSANNGAPPLPTLWHCTFSVLRDYFGGNDFGADAGSAKLALSPATPQAGALSAFRERGWQIGFSTGLEA